MVVRLRRWGAVALVGVLAAGCAGDDDSATSPSALPPTAAPAVTPTAAPASTAPTSSEPPATAVPPASTTPLAVDPGELGVLDAALAPDGTIDPDAALALVAAGYGPIPGVAPAATPLVDGGPALRAVLARLDELAAEQQTALSAIVAGPAVPLADATAAASPRLAAAAAVVSNALTAFAQTSAGALPADTRVTMLEVPLDVGDGHRRFSSPQAQATAVQLADGDDRECRILVNASAPLDPTLGTADPAFTLSLAREAFHCLQAARADDLAAVPLWVLEGAAGYAAVQVAGPGPPATAWWQRWAAQPERPLELRTYDAIGFFTLVGQTADAYAFADALLGDPGPDSVRRRLEPTDVFDRWGQQYATRPDWGPAFTFPGASATGLTAPRTPLTLTVDGPGVTIGGRATSELSAAAYELTAPGDVLVLSTGPGDRGVIRFADGQSLRLAEATQSVCVAAGGCACPGLPADALAISDAAGSDVFIGIGPSSGAGPTLTARSLARWCQDVLVPPPPAGAIDPCLVQTWTSRAYTAPSAPGVTQTIAGGQGAQVAFAADGTVHVDMGATTPVVITTTTAAGVVTSTTLTYRGSGSGTWSAAGGTVEIAGVDPSTYGIHVRVESSDGRMTSDVDLPITDIRLAGFANLLGTARYVCTPVSLSLTHVVPGVGGTAGFELVPG